MVVDPPAPIIVALAAAERQGFDDSEVDAVALRYGLFYGRDIITMAELLRRRLATHVSMSVSSATAHRDLGWQPRYPSHLEGLLASAALVRTVA